MGVDRRREPVSLSIVLTSFLAPTPADVMQTAGVQKDLPRFAAFLLTSPTVHIWLPSSTTNSLANSQLRSLCGPGKAAHLLLDSSYGADQTQALRRAALSKPKSRKRSVALRMTVTLYACLARGPCPLCPLVPAACELIFRPMKEHCDPTARACEPETCIGR